MLLNRGTLAIDTLELRPNQRLGGWIRPLSSVRGAERVAAAGITAGMGGAMLLLEVVGLGNCEKRVTLYAVSSRDASLSNAGGMYAWLKAVSVAACILSVFLHQYLTSITKRFYLPLC